jgi:hypothetical protein
MTRPPDHDEYRRRKELAGVGFKQSLEAQPLANDRYRGGWLDLSTFALLHPTSHIRLTDAVVDYNPYRQYKYRMSLPALEYRKLTEVTFCERQSVEATDRYTDLHDRSRAVEIESEPLVVTYGIDETFWQSLATFEFANRGYIVFPEAISDRWTFGCPDLTCFRLGQIQEVLSDIGIVPGGASLPEIELRAEYGEYEPTDVDAGETVGVVEAKGEGKAKKGKRELVDKRGRRKEPYLEGEAVECGWVIAPNATKKMRSWSTKVGGVTWENQEVRYFDSPAQAVDQEQLTEQTSLAKRYVLDLVLRRWELPCTLETAIEICLDNPEELYTYARQSQ